MDWIQEAIAQLEATIKIFIDTHNSGDYLHIRAFACNKRHPHFQVIDNSQKQEFYSKYRVRLNIQAKIAVE